MSHTTPNPDDLSPENLAEVIAEGLADEMLMRGLTMIHRIPAHIIQKQLESARNHHCDDPQCGRKQQSNIKLLTLVLQFQNDMNALRVEMDEIMSNEKEDDPSRNAHLN